MCGAEAVRGCSYEATGATGTADERKGLRWPEARGHKGSEPVGGQAVRPLEEQRGHTWDGTGAERREASRVARKLQGG